MDDDQSSAGTSSRTSPPEAILTTKLYIPTVRSHVVARPRLIGLLDQGLSSRLILVSAPAGFGKTTLVSQWLAASAFITPQSLVGQRPSAIASHVAWLSLDERDNDPARFLRYLVAALRQIDPVIGQAVQAMAYSPQPPPHEVLLTVLINDLASVSDPFVLVLDDYQLIQTLAIHQQLGFLVEHQPPHMHLVVISREDPPLPLSRLRARAQVTEIRQADLQFTVGETADFLRQAAQAELAPNDLAALHARTEGWIAGLQLLALSMRGCDDTRQLVESFTGSSRYVLDYLIEEVFQRQPPEVRDFLVKTSLLDRLTAPLCNALTGRSDSRDLLASLERANLFIVPLDQSREWYRYHHLFADLLRHRLETEAPDQAPEIHRRACDWLADHGLASEAIGHALATGDWQRASDLIFTVSSGMLNRGEVATLLGWLAMLPRDFVRSQPRVCLEYGWPLILSGQIAAAEEYLMLAEVGAAGDTVLLGPIASAQAYAARVRGDARRAIELSQRALALLPSDDWPSRSVVTMNLGMIYWYAGFLDRAEHTFREAQEAARHTESPYVQVTVQTYLGKVQAGRGQLLAAAAVYRQVIEQARGLPIPHVAHADLARLLYEQNELQAAADHAQQAVDIGKASFNAEFHLAGVRTLALVKLAQGDADAARQGMERIKQLLQHPGLSQSALAYALAYQIVIALGLRDLDEAARLAARVPPPDGAVPVAEYGLMALARARLLLAQGQRDEVAAFLSRLHALVSAAGFQWYVAEARVLQALAASTPDEALAFLAEALPLAERERCVRTFVDLGEPMAALLREAAARRMAPDYIGHLLAAFRTDEQRDNAFPAARVAQPLVEPLSDRELSVLRMLAEHTNREIAAALYISDNTVKAHLKSIYGKLGVGSRHEASAKARKLGLLS